MNLRMTVIELNIEGGDMSKFKWIDDLKKEVEEGKTEKARQDDIRLRKDKIIEAKLPAFWEELLQQIEGQCAALKKELPDTNQYHLCMQRTHYGFILASETLPLRKLFGELNINGQCIDITADYKGRRLSIDVDAAHDNGLRLRFEGIQYFTAEELARALVMDCIRGK